MSEILRVENLRVEFETNAGQVKALNGVSFSQEQGQIYCIVGESGAGKSNAGPGDYGPAARVRHPGRGQRVLQRR